MSMVMTEEDRDVETSRRGQRDTFFNSNMYFYGREICFILAIIITSYAALQNAPPKISKSPSPVPFFPRTSLVADFYHGQLSPVFERVSESDVSFVMYYAPWDAESQATRMQFKITAQYFYKQVYFAAINCWQPQSECRQQFAKVQQFPVLIVYTQHSRGVQYRGLREAPHMIRFLSEVLHPMHRITSQQELVDLMTKYDAVVVGFFTFAGNLGSPGYYMFYSTALKFLERDPHREIGFAVCTDPHVARQLMVAETPAIRIYMWNETLQYSEDDELSADKLVKWISSHTHQVAVWVSPPGVKSLTLAPYVEDGSVLVVFTPRNPLQERNYNYDLLREVALEYYNCDDNPWVASLANRLAADRADAMETYEDDESDCSSRRERPVEHDVPSVQVVGKQWTNGSCRDFCGNICHASMGPLRHNFYLCCKPLTQDSHQMSLLTGAGDDRASPALQEATLYEKCRRLRRARLVHNPVFPRAAYHRKSPRNFSGLACRTNKTISFIAMDTLHFHQFAEGLGIDILRKPDKTAVVIFNIFQESSFVLDSELSKGSMMEFISNYTDGTLNRSLRSSSNSSRNLLHLYPEQSAQNCHGEGVVCVRELNSKNFHQVVMSPNEAVVVLYHSPYCGFCQGVSHMFLTVARYFRAVHNLTFVRIDGENNDLPWEFTMHHYPTILFFPALRKSESRVFPRQHPVTIANLVNFVLDNLDPGEETLRGMIGLCAAWQSAQDDSSARDCVVRVRKECLAAIDRTLRQYRAAKTRWRLDHRQLKLSFYQLQYLREVHLILSTVSRLTEDGVEYAAILNAYERYESVRHLHFQDSTDASNFTSTVRFVRDEL